jgi:toxin secretion/phage lysis holin
MASIGLLVFTNEEQLGIFLLVFVILIDTALGICVAIKYKIPSSHRMGRMAKKVSMYAASLLTVFALANTYRDMFGWTMRAFSIFLVLTETFSIFEKLSLLGMNLPTKMLSKINRNFHDLYFGDDEKKNDALSSILSKEQCGNKKWFLKN